MSRPVLVVTGHAPPDRLGAFAALAAREDVLFALFGGRLRHATAAEQRAQAQFAHRQVSEREAGALAASGRYRAVICGAGGRVALPAVYAGARRARVPFVLWSGLWAHPRSPAHLLSWPLMRHLYRHADALATYGPHVSAYVRGHGARSVFEAPQAVENAYWSAQAPDPHRLAGFQVVFVGRLAREKGYRSLVMAWRASGLQASDAALVLVGGGHPRSQVPAASAAYRRRGWGPAIHLAGPLPAQEVRNFYAGSDVCVLPSIPTSTFREPWGLAANEAMNQGLAIIATDAVGAAAGGLVRHEDTGLVVPAGDHEALAGALARLRADRALRHRLGAAGRAAVVSYTYDAWAEGMLAALAAAEGVGGAC